jgi:hypothetical protein
LARRLAEIEGQRDIAFSADRDPAMGVATGPSGWKAAGTDASRNDDAGYVQPRRPLCRSAQSYVERMVPSSTVIPSTMGFLLKNAGAPAAAALARSSTRRTSIGCGSSSAGGS